MKAERDTQNGAEELRTPISKEYLRSVLDKEQRKQEKEIQAAISSERHKEVEALFQEHGLEIVKDIDKVELMMEGVQRLSRKIDEAESLIEINTARYKEAKRAIFETRKIRERVEDAIEGVEKIRKMEEIVEELKRVSIKTMLDTEKMLNKREAMKEAEVRAIYQWTSAVKKLEKISKYFADHRFYTKLWSVIQHTHVKLETVANLMVQWWICELVTGVEEVARARNRKSSKKDAEKNREGDEASREAEERQEAVGIAQEARQFAKKNKVLVRTGKYIYEEIGKKEDFTKYVNEARVRELGKLCKLEVHEETPEIELVCLLSAFKEFIKVDRDIAEVVPQKIDAVTEEYDEMIKRKTESLLSRPEFANMEEEAVIREMKDLFTFAMGCGVYLKECSEILLQCAYKCIHRENERAKDRVKKAAEEEGSVKERLFHVQTEVLEFFRKARGVIQGVEQIEDELDEIVLKCVNEEISVARESVQISTPEESVASKDFAEDIHRELALELMCRRSETGLREYIFARVPELGKIEEKEREIARKTNGDLKKEIEDVIRQIKIKTMKITKETEVSLYSSKVGRILESYEHAVEKEVLEERVEEVFRTVLHQLPQMKTYKQVYAVEREFAIMYRTAQSIGVKSATAQEGLKIFTELEELRKTRTDTAEELGADVEEIFKKYKGLDGKG